ncbi:MAG TPA: META domain-containing protein [Brevefilum fermentans]|jgi:heat shock protein HslJ|uniref:DUF306 domain-containing protein n=1 Tax=Candidatus Brevifilum fermentans TaxID=1986204 RepID=A0A1Y6K459_9CHLR|nr:META domain-containing protein [Brevefilum fermentans]MDI9566555.1 META domain-containing protein [Chloroflexota bacterium]OQB86579.1 MAG: heat-inducible protein [Chloroflexi bacterium ADurb.Bin120]SMX53648.1 conserved exported protein of unknown function [Brevefilum fermentans]HOM67646.1 META domain-containing protein [Brevefilum fermentans]HPX96473.1 META domain-containing protein [Brevefilum fermentans]
MKTKNMLIVLTLALTLTLAACSTHKGDIELKGTSWSLVEIHGQPILEGTTPTLIFDEEGIGGNASCNIFGGNYTLDKGKLTFDQLFNTEMYCEGAMDQETAYINALQEVVGFKIENGNLQLLDTDGQVILAFAPQK